MYIAILGRQPKLSIAELERTTGRGHIKALTQETALLDQLVAVNHHGGLVKLAQELPTKGVGSWREAIFAIEKTLLDEPASSKRNIGLSLYGVKASGRAVAAELLALKKRLKSYGLSVRVVNRQKPVLSSAEVTHNHLTDTPHAEFIIASLGGALRLGRTLAVQDIESYSVRDFGRPKRDPRVGMLPPKLAQIMINLAKPAHGATVLDPFCGTGVVLQEALLAGYMAIGSDKDERMVSYSRENLAALEKSFSVPATDWSVSRGDATTMLWSKGIGAVVSEMFLGPPLAKTPTSNQLESIRSEIDTLLARFLTNLRPQIRIATPVVLAVPAWRVASHFVHLKNVDSLEELGYSSVSFAHVKSEELLYSRPDQIVARQLLVLTRK